MKLRLFIILIFLSSTIFSQPSSLFSELEGMWNSYDADVLIPLQSTNNVEYWSHLGNIIFYSIKNNSYAAIFGHNISIHSIKKVANDFRILASVNGIGYVQEFLFIIHFASKDKIWFELIDVYFPGVGNRVKKDDLSSTIFRRNDWNANNKFIRSEKYTKPKITSLKENTLYLVTEDTELLEGDILLGGILLTLKKDDLVTVLENNQDRIFLYKGKPSIIVKVKSADGYIGLIFSSVLKQLN